MTFSIAARCPDTGMLGIAVTSSSICVASRCGFVGTGTAAALSQNITNPVLGDKLLSLCAEGLTAPQALEQLCRTEEKINWRQLAVVDANGNVAHFSGEEALGVHGAATGQACVSVGNLLSSTNIPQAVIDGFEASKGHLAGRLIAALEAGLHAGGEAGSIHSAGVKVVDKLSWPCVDLRVDWDDEPDKAVTQLRSIWQNYQPQMNAYIVRAVNPAESESYGVPGDE